MKKWLFDRSSHCKKWSQSDVLNGWNEDGDSRLNNSDILISIFKSIRTTRSLEGFWTIQNGSQIYHIKIEKKMELFIAIFLQQFAPGVIGWLSYFIYQRTEKIPVWMSDLFAFMFLWSVVWYLVYLALNIFLAKILIIIPDLKWYETEAIRAISWIFAFMFKPFIRLFESIFNLFAAIAPDFIKKIWKTWFK